MFVRLVPLLLAVSCTCAPKGAAPPEAGSRYRKIDVHTHFGPSSAGRMLALMDEQGLDQVVDLSGGWPGAGLEQSLAMARAHPGRMVIFANPPLDRLAHGTSMDELLKELEEAHRLGAKGLKFFKALGLSVVDEDGKLRAVDDPRLDPLFDKAGELGMPIAIHTGDPVAFWQPPTADNERFDELSVHPRWSYYGRPVPSWEALFSAYERRVARSPRTTFIGVHFGNAPEDPDRVAAMLDRYPNLLVDTAARVPELGRGDPAHLRALFLAHADRILFGTDLGVGDSPASLMLGSTGATPPGPEDVARFFGSTWRYFETSDRAIPSPTPIQGRWSIDGLGLPPDVLRKLYSENAERLLGK